MNMANPVNRNNERIDLSIMNETPLLIVICLELAELDIARRAQWRMSERDD
jgi:hypothetical protein